MPNFSPADMLAALNSAEADWLALVGAAWPKIEAQYQTLRARLASGAEADQMLAAVEVAQLFSPHDAARERLSAALTARTEAGAVLLALAELADQLGLDPATSALFRAPAQPEGISRFIVQNNPTEAMSIKFGNLKLEFESLSALGVFVLTTTAKEILKEADGILLAAGVLAIIATLYKATAIKLAEREATVFWGFARAPRRADGTVKEEVLLAHVNAVRHDIGREPLTQPELKNALHELEKIKSVARVAGQAEVWQIIEKYNLTR